MCPKLASSTVLVDNDESSHILFLSVFCHLLYVCLLSLIHPSLPLFYPLVFNYILYICLSFVCLFSICPSYMYLSICPFKVQSLFFIGAGAGAGSETLYVSVFTCLSFVIFFHSFLPSLICLLSIYRYP